MGRVKHVTIQQQALETDDEQEDPIRAATQAKEKRKGATVACILLCFAWVSC